VQRKFDVLTFDDTYQIPAERVLYIDAGICIGSYLFCDWNHVAPLLVNWTWTVMSLISNFCRVLHVVCFFQGNSPASESYMLTFRNTLSLHLHMHVGVHLHAYEDGTDRVFWNVGIWNSDAGELPRRKHTAEMYFFLSRTYKWTQLIIWFSLRQCVSVCYMTLSKLRSH